MMEPIHRHEGFRLIDRQDGAVDLMDPSTGRVVPFFPAFPVEGFDSPSEDRDGLVDPAKSSGQRDANLFERKNPGVRPKRRRRLLEVFLSDQRHEHRLADFLFKAHQRLLRRGGRA